MTRTLAMAWLVIAVSFQSGMLCPMDSHIARFPLTSLRLPRQARRWLPGLALIAAGAMALPVITHRETSVDSPSMVVNQVVHCRDARHEWLLVADRNAHELVVYDAGTGAPLHRLGTDDGLGEVDSVACLGDLLLVQERGGDRQAWLRLPGLQPVNLAAR